jgi:hypothetical protein
MDTRYTTKSAQIKCTICGKLFHARGLHMHMKLAHDNSNKKVMKSRLLSEGSRTNHTSIKINEQEKEQLFILLGAFAGYLGYRLLKKR